MYQSTRVASGSVQLSSQQTQVLFAGANIRVIKIQTLVLPCVGTSRNASLERWQQVMLFSVDYRTLCEA